MLQHSDDGAAWETLASWYGLDWSDGLAKTLHGANASAALPAGTAIMWRVNVTANNGDSSFTEIAEMELRAAIGGADQTTSSAVGPFGSSNASRVASAFDSEGASGTPVRFNSPVTGWVAYRLFRGVESHREYGRSFASVGGETVEPEMIRSVTFYCGTRTEKRDVGGVIFTSLIADYVKLDFPFGVEGSRGQPHPPSTADEDLYQIYG